MASSMISLALLRGFSYSTISRSIFPFKRRTSSSLEGLTPLFLGLISTKWGRFCQTKHLQSGWQVEQKQLDWVGTILLVYTMASFCLSMFSKSLGSQLASKVLRVGSKCRCFSYRCSKMGLDGPVSGQRKAQRCYLVPRQNTSYYSSSLYSIINKRNIIAHINNQFVWLGRFAIIIKIQMSKANDKFASTFYNEQRKKIAKTPPKNEGQLRRTQPKSFEGKKKLVDNQSFHDIALHEKDERFRYLLKHGELKKVEKSGNIIFAELPQIPNVWVCYRRPVEREANMEKLNLDGLQLSHVPLLEGEEKLKMLTFQHNKIGKIENLISLPNLLYLDLHDNLIKDIENIAIPSVKVLLIAKNQLTKIKNISDIPKLEVLDLHSNKIAKMEGFSLLTSLRILNLSHNQIVKIQNLEPVANLNQLNLKSNLIIHIEGLQKLTKLEKCFLANNRIEIKQFQACELNKLPLKELTLDNNPCSKDKIPFLRNVLKYMPNLKLLDGKVPTLMQEEQNESEQEENHEQVLKLIASQWQEEKKRIMQIQASNGGKKQFLKSSCITGGHAEIEDETILFIYGNSYDVVLTNQSFQETVEKIRFEYIFIEFLIEQNILSTLKKFKKLKIIEFRECYVMSLLQIAKLENLQNLKIVNIEPHGNPISHCTFLKEFIIYRFPAIIQINREDVKESDRARAKTLFQNFDKVLQIPQKSFGPEAMRNYPSEQPNAKKDKNYLKAFNKLVNEGADQIVEQQGARCEAASALKNSLEGLFDGLLTELISKARVRQQ